MNEPIRQHYVPQTYLKGFDNGSGKGPRVFALDASNGRILDVSTKKTSAENHFYTLDRNSKKKDKDEKYYWENYYARVIEPELGTLLLRIISRCESALIQNKAVVLSSKEKEMFASHLHTQLLRGKHARAFAKTIYSQHLPLVIDSLKEIIPPSDTEKWDLVEKFRLDYNMFLETLMSAILTGTNTKRYLSIMLQRSFVVFRATHNAVFVTSDHPVSFIDTMTHNATPFESGLINHSTLVMFPLSPSLLLCAFHPEYHSGLYNWSDCRLRFMKAEVQQLLIEYSNQAQLNQCVKFVYSSNEEVLKSLHNNRFPTSSSLPFLV